MRTCADRVVSARIGRWRAPAGPTWCWWGVRARIARPSVAREAETHLVAAHPRIQGAVFPSKLWNSLAAGRRILYSGFAGAMQAELEASVVSRY